jgi:hypothetical protein
MRLDNVWLQTTLNTPNISGPLFLRYTTADVSNKQIKLKKNKNKKNLPVDSDLDVVGGLSN